MALHVWPSTETTRSEAKFTTIPVDYVVTPEHEEGGFFGPAEIKFPCYHLGLDDVVLFKLHAQSNKVNWTDATGRT